MNRLNATIRNQIVENAIKKAGIEDERESLRARRAEWAEKCRIKSLGGEVAVKEMHEAVQQMKELYKKVPEGVGQLYSSILRQNEYLDMNIAGMSYLSYFCGRHNSEPKCVKGHVHKVTPYRFTLEESDPLAAEFFELEKAKEDLDSKEQTLTGHIKGTLSRVTTIKKLIAAWPESKELLPEEVESKETLPAIPVADLNNMIGLPSEAAAA